MLKQALDPDAVDYATSSRLNTFPILRSLYKNIVCLLIKTAVLTAPITKMVKKHAELAVVNKAEFYDTSTKVGRKSQEAKPPPPLTGRSAASSVSQNMTREDI